MKKTKEKEILKWQKIKIMNITSTRWDDARVWCVEGREGGVEGRHQWISCQKLEYIERNISPKMYIFSEIRNQWIYCHQWEYFQTNILPSFNILSKIEIFWKMNYKTMVMSPWNQNYLLLPKICMKEIFTTLHVSMRWLIVQCADNSKLRTIQDERFFLNN